MFMETSPYDTSEKAAAGRTPEQIEDTIAFWKGRGTAFSPEEARSMVKAAKSFFELLEKWEQAELEKNSTKSF